MKRDRLVKANETLGLIKDNRNVLVAALSMVVASVAYPDHDQQYGDAGAEAQRICMDRLGIPNSDSTTERELTAEESSNESRFADAIGELSLKMEAALIRAGLLPEWNRN